MSQAELEKMKTAFPAFLHERMPVLTEFFTDLGVSNPALVLIDAKSYIEPLESFLKDQTINLESRTWIVTRVGYFLGEYFVQEYTGDWYLNENIQSRNYLRYVVGHFDGFNEAISIDPFEIAIAYIDSNAPRSIIQFIEEVSRELASNK